MLHHSAQSRTVTQAQNRCQPTQLCLQQCTHPLQHHLAASAACGLILLSCTCQRAQQVPNRQQLQPGHAASLSDALTHCSSIHTTQSGEPVGNHCSVCVGVRADMWVPTPTRPAIAIIWAAAAAHDSPFSCMLQASLQITPNRDAQTQCSIILTTQLVSNQCGLRGDTKADISAEQER